jgi:hypothetical protein
MSWQSCPDPAPAVVQVADAIETVIVPRARDLAGVEVHRAIPWPTPNSAGPIWSKKMKGPTICRVLEGSAQ